MKTVYLLLISLLTSPVLAAETEELHDDIQQDIQFKLIEQKAAECLAAISEGGLVIIDKKQAKRYCELKAWTQVTQPGRYAIRIVNERATELNPFVITPHKLSYILPVTYTDNFNLVPYESNQPYFDELRDIESKYQVSFKVPLHEEQLFIRGDGLYFGMTIQAWWQVYSNPISRPFRETNYQPEIFYIAPLPFKPLGGNMGVSLHFEHQSNGQSQLLSRSWNRILASVLYEKGDLYLNFKPWYRIKEEQKSDPLQPRGDDNPDIEDYLGHFEFSGAYAFSNEQKLAFMMRKNWRTGNGAIELNLTTPLWGRLMGMIHYFNGYGESLIDYNHKQQKIGIGVALTEIF